ncbi:adenine phosphoribosyltransferase [Myxococcota bacterium]|nr:adenine phosphoribosyltransferase [Myxococcota bacterium]
MQLQSLIRTIPDYPKAGILFRDITTLLQDPEGFRATVAELLAALKGITAHKVVGIEARGFILGGVVAHALGAGFVPIRKKGKLPGATLGEDYELEYGTDRLEIHSDALNEGDDVLVIDDLIATGGTLQAACRLIERMNARVIACAAVIDLPDLGGSAKLEDEGYRIISLCEFSGS